MLRHAAFAIYDTTPFDTLANTPAHRFTVYDAGRFTRDNALAEAPPVHKRLLFIQSAQRFTRNIGARPAHAGLPAAARTLMEDTEWGLRRDHINAAQSPVMILLLDDAAITRSFAACRVSRMIVQPCQAGCSAARCQNVDTRDI